MMYQEAGNFIRLRNLSSSVSVIGTIYICKMRSGSLSNVYGLAHVVKLLIRTENTTELINSASRSFLKSSLSEIGRDSIKEIANVLVEIYAFYPSLSNIDV